MKRGVMANLTKTATPGRNRRPVRADMASAAHMITILATFIAFLLKIHSRRARRNNRAKKILAKNSP